MPKEFIEAGRKEASIYEKYKAYYSYVFYTAQKIEGHLVYGSVVLGYPEDESKAAALRKDVIAIIWELGTH